MRESLLACLNRKHTLLHKGRSFSVLFRGKDQFFLVFLMGVAYGMKARSSQAESSTTAHR